MALVLKAIPAQNDDEALAVLSREYPEWQFEMASDGSLLVSPTYSEGGARELVAGLQLYAYAARVGGKSFGPSAGFRLADNSVRAPDASWMSAAHVARLTADERSKFWRTCPDVVIEILSDTDVWERLLEKLDLYERNGARYVVGIDPFERRVAMRGTPPDGLVLDTDAIIDA
ncbi:MAG: Uma2 family endonuclease [Vulcanimicrobiaceae bacterium]